MGERFLLIALLMTNPVQAAVITPVLDTLSASPEQVEFEKTVQKAGLAFYQGDWELLKAEGDDSCTLKIRSSLVAADGLRFEPLASVFSARPNFSIKDINQGDQWDVDLSGILFWSRAVFEGALISQRETRRAMIMIVDRADRQLEVFRDGSLSITVSEGLGLQNERYRCVYRRSSGKLN